MCNLPAAGEEIGLTGTKHAGKEEIQVSTAKKEIVCRLCPEQFANQADLMRHYRENHPIDRDRLLKLRMEGKSPEQIAIIMERSPSTVRYHLYYKGTARKQILRKEIEGNRERFLRAIGREDLIEEVSF